MANFLNDTFTEASATNVTSHTPESGGAWSLQSGFASPVPVIGAGTGRMAFDSAAYAVIGKVSATPPSADYTVTATGKIQASANLVGAVARLAATGLTCIAGWVGNNGKAEIQRYGGAGTTTLFTTAYAVSLNTDYTVELEVSGTTLTLRVNGVTVGTATDASITAAGNAGFIGIGQVSYDSITAGVAASDVITQTEQTAGKVYQRSGSSSSISFSGTYSGTAPTAVEVKIVNAVGGTTAQDWTALSSATISGGAWSGSLSVPQGGMYNFISRTKNGASVLATASQSTNAFGVGAIFVVAGQSNGARMFTVGSVSPIATTNQYNGAYVANAGAGSCTLANAISTNLGIPVTMVNTAVEGSGLIVATASPYGSWADTSGALYTNWKNKVTALGGKIEGVLWLQGEWDAGQNATKSAYKTDFLALIARMRAYTSQPSLPIFITPLTRYTGGTFAGWDNVQDAFMESFDSTVKKTCDTWDLPSDDGLHYNAAAQAILGTRISLAVRKYFGQPVESLGPLVTGVVVSGSTVDITFSHVSGSDITPSSGITGLTFTANGIAATPTSVVRQSANVVRATFATAPALPVYVAVAVGTNPNASAPLKDNTGLPAQRTATAGVTEVAGSGGVFVKVGGTYKLSMSVHIKVAGGYKQADEIHIKESGAYALL